MRSRATLRAAGVSALALGLATAFPVTAGAAGKVAFTLQDDRVTEASGMARDTKNQVYWVVNDSGALGVVYGVDAKGKVKGTLRYNAFPLDAEAVAWNKDRLYVGDIGDNDQKRKSVRVYYFDDPEPDDETRTYKAWDFRYPDGAHDAETLLVAPSGRLYIATKDVKGGLYRAPKKPSRDGVNTLKRVGDAPSTVTDGVVLPGGDRIAYLTYAKVVVVDEKTGDEKGSAEVTGVPQAEAIAVGLDPASVMVGGEGKASKVYAVPVPGAATPGAPTPAAGDGGSDDEPDDSAAAPAARERGTFLAVGLAALVAVVAGVVVGVVRRPG